jgi:flagellar basal body rod protein FlgG
MPGGYYIALSGMRTRIDDLDRLSDEIANASTAGFKGQRTGHAEAPRASFADALETAIDVSGGATRLDARPGIVTSTGRDLDIAVDADGFLAVETGAGVRYTRNGHLMRGPEGTLTTEDGGVVLGEDGPITLADGTVSIGEDGTVRAGGEVAGRLSIVRFADPRQLSRDHAGALLRAGDQAALPIDNPTVHVGALEQSNVSVVERVAEITNVARSFEALQKAVSVLMNDVDGRTIESLGRR